MRIALELHQLKICIMKYDFLNGFENSYKAKRWSCDIFLKTIDFLYLLYILMLGVSLLFII